MHFSPFENIFLLLNEHFSWIFNYVGVWVSLQKFHKENRKERREKIKKKFAKKSVQDLSKKEMKNG